MTESTIASRDLGCLAHGPTRTRRGYAPQPAIEWKAGERCAVLAWLNVRSAELRHAGLAVRRLRFRQRRRVWAGKIAYDDDAVAVAHCLPVFRGYDARTRGRRAD